MYTAEFILLWVCFAPWADRKSQSVKGCGTSATSFPLCFARWPGVKRHSPEAAFDTLGKVSPRHPKSCVKARHFHKCFLGKIFLGSHGNLTAWVFMFSVFPEGSPHPGSETPTMACLREHNGAVILMEPSAWNLCRKQGLCRTYLLTYWSPCYDMHYDILLQV